MKTPILSLAKELHLGEIAYQFYYKPTAQLRFYQSRGAWNILAAQIGERALKRNLESFPNPKYGAVDVKISFLTGENIGTKPFYVHYRWYITLSRYPLLLFI